MQASDYKLLLDGAWVTLWVSFSAIGIGVFAGLFLAILRRANIAPLNALIALYVSVGRSTSLVTLVLLLFLGAPMFGWDLSATSAAIAALALNTTAFNAEIWRAAFKAFPKEQIEAGLACGMTPAKLFMRIMLPQMWLSSLPALINEMSFILKSSPAIAVVGVVDLTRTINRISAVTYDPLPPILAACVLYMVMVGLLVYLQRLAERKTRRLAM